MKCQVFIFLIVSAITTFNWIMTPHPNLDLITFNKMAISQTPFPVRWHWYRCKWTYFDRLNLFLNISTVCVCCCANVVTRAQGCLALHYTFNLSVWVSTSGKSHNKVACYLIQFTFICHGRNTVRDIWLAIVKYKYQNIYTIIHSLVKTTNSDQN